MRRKFTTSVLILVMAAVLPACQFAKVGARCSASQGAARTTTHVLFCVQGKWKASLTIGQAASFIVSTWPGSAVSSIGNDIGATTSVAMPEFDLTVTTRGGRPAANADLTLGLVAPGQTNETRLTLVYRTNADGVVRITVPGPLRPGFARNGVYTLRWYGTHPDPILTQRVSVSSRPTSLVLVDGDAQRVTAGSALGPVRFEVQDSLGLRARGATVRLDGAEYLGGPTVTDVDGLITVQSGTLTQAGARSFNLTLTEAGPFGPRNVTYVRVTYDVAPGPVDDAYIYGDDQSAAVNSSFTELSVRPIDEYGNLIRTLPVTFSAIAGPSGASGTVTAATSESANVVANGVAGEWNVRAEVPGLGNFDFTLTNV